VEVGCLGGAKGVRKRGAFRAFGAGNNNSQQGTLNAQCSSERLRSCAKATEGGRRGVRGGGPAREQESRRKESRRKESRRECGRRFRPGGGVGSGAGGSSVQAGGASVSLAQAEVLRYLGVVVGVCGVAGSSVRVKGCEGGGFCGSSPR
jgi:hypothetical protein